LFSFKTATITKIRKLLNWPKHTLFQVKMCLNLTEECFNIPVYSEDFCQFYTFIDKAYLNKKSLNSLILCNNYAKINQTKHI
jgi:hypothetical protein